jgi:transketolase
LYWAVLRISPSSPRDEHRDRFILSKGHAAPVLFQVLAARDFFPVSDLEHYGENGSIFGEHPPAPKYLPGIEAATGSLGHGLPMAVGMALAARILGADYRTFVVLSDGECNEGSVWEAALMAAAQKLESLTVFVDYNKWQATGRSNEVLGLAPLADKWAAFGWFVHEIDGHDFSAIEAAVAARDELKRPKIIVAHTVKGKGVSFMEDDNNWHYRIPTADEVRKAAVELQIPAESIRLDGLAPRTHE